MFLTAMPKTFSNPTPEDVMREVGNLWKSRDATKRLGALLAPWTRDTAEDGSTVISARVLGDGAEDAMVAFCRSTTLVLSGPGEQWPRMSYAETGWVVCSWRDAGVWVRLWAADTAAAPAPTPLVMPARVAPLPSGRLPYRRNTTPKGN